jgi:hypothetical protein
MTEQQRDAERMLAELLDVSDLVDDSTLEAARYIPPVDETPGPLLTPVVERRLLEEANAVGTPALIPDEPGLKESATQQDRTLSSSAAGEEIVALVRRYLIPALLAAAGAVYVLLRKRRTGR